MDVLSDILRSMHLRGSVDFRCEATAPWAMSVGASPSAVFHIVTSGECWIRTNERADAVLLIPGDIVVLSHGRAHALLSDPTIGTAAPPSTDALNAHGEFGPLRLGGGGSETTVLCGQFTHDAKSRNAIVDVLPPFLHLRGGDESDDLSLQPLILMMLGETRASLPGARTAVNRLCETLFVRIVRRYLAQAPHSRGILAGLADAAIASMLRALHAAPEREWTMGDMATAARMSRSRFASHFRALLGETPMQYVTRWRMDLARRMLLESRLSLAQVAEQVGYSSVASFSKTFKRVVGVGPGAYRRTPPPGPSLPPCDETPQ